MIFQCDKGYAFYQFVKLIQDNPQIVMILGGDCSSSTQTIAEASPYWNLVEVIIVALFWKRIWISLLHLFLLLFLVIRLLTFLSGKHRNNTSLRE